jgi:hypothetical protein
MEPLSYTVFREAMFFGDQTFPPGPTPTLYSSTYNRFGGVLSSANQVLIMSRSIIEGILLYYCKEITVDI